jgi:putative IMPACT (imprinted ancient) family translation regulator
VSDPLANIEDSKGQRDLGVFAVRVFDGALAETGSWLKAYFATAAFFHGMFKTPPEDSE